jgi:restriction system protein
MTTAARRPPRRRPRRRGIKARLSAVHWGWWAAATVAAVIWPIQVAVIATALALAGVAAAVLLGRLNPHTRTRLLVTLPRPRRAGGRDLAAYLALKADDFEHAIAQLARRDPHVRSAVRQGGADDRVSDVLVHLHDGHRIVIQCKRYAPDRPVPAGVVYELNGTYRAWHHAHAAVIVTTSRFTRSAREFASAPEVGIRLVDGERLAAWSAGGPPPWA